MTAPDHERHMRRAVELAGNNPDSPFGCVIVDSESDRVFAEAFNEGYRNPTRHGETAAIYDLAEKDPNVDWTRLTLYTTAEPCPMCAGAILWSGIPTVVIGTSMETLRDLGLPHIGIPLREVCERSSEEFLEPEIVSGVLESECDALYRG